MRALSVTALLVLSGVLAVAGSNLSYSSPGYHYECADGTPIYIDHSNVDIADRMTDAACGVIEQ